MRVLIADDEFLARSSLKSMLGELDQNLELVGEAANGEEMVKLVQKYQPEIVFVDIKMPTLSGLEGIKIGRELSPDTRWVILTGFSDFQFALEAVKLGAYDYLLKPVGPEELKKILNSLAKDNNKRLGFLNRQFEADIVALYYGLSSLSREEADSFILKAHFYGAILYSDSYLDEKTKAQRLADLLNKARQLKKESLSYNSRLALFTLPGGELAIFGAWESIVPKGKILVSQYLKQLEELAQRLSGLDFKFTIFYSGVCLSYFELQTNLDRLQKLAGLRALLGGWAWELKTLNHYAAQPVFLEAVEILLNLVEYYQERAYLSYSNTLFSLERFLIQSRLLENSTIKKQLASFLNCSLKAQLESDQNLDSWLASLQKRGEHLLAENNKEDNSDLVKSVLSFIEQNYPSDIGITQIAQQLNVTPNYLSSLFHKKTGQTFMKYLTRIRLLKAQQLLTASNLSIQQIAEQVGYYSTRHFTKLFTEFAGCYPSEYRKRLELSKLE